MKRATIVMLAVLGLAGCGGGGVGDDAVIPGESKVVHVFEVETMPPGVGAGYTSWDDDGVTRVYLLRGWPGDLPLLTTHELMHAVGMVEHETDVECILHQPSYGDFGHPPCPREHARLQRVDGLWHVYVQGGGSEELGAAVDAAIVFLNAARGVEILVRE